MQTFEQLTKSLLDFQRYEKDDFLESCIQDVMVRMGPAPERKRISFDELVGPSSVPATKPQKQPDAPNKNRSKEPGKI